MDEFGTMCKSKEDIQQAIINYYKILFIFEAQGGMEGCLSTMNWRVTNVMNSQLLKEFTVEKINGDLNQMHSLKAPGQDGCAACFYQNNWITVEEEVCNVILSFLNSGHLHLMLNFTYIASNLKVKNPSNASEFRPISLCNMIYKIILKVLTNRLKVVLPHFHSQSAFIHGPLITNNILAAYKMLHLCKPKCGGMRFHGLEIRYEQNLR